MLCLSRGSFFTFQKNPFKIHKTVGDFRGNFFFSFIARVNE